MLPNIPHSQVLEEQEPKPLPRMEAAPLVPMKIVESLLPVQIVKSPPRLVIVIDGLAFKLWACKAQQQLMIEKWAM